MSKKEISNDHILSNVNISDVLDTKLKIYSYVTDDHEPGTIITPHELEQIFDNDVLFKMYDVSHKNISLRQLLEKGFISVGSTDIMETLDIEYPLFNTTKKPTIKGKYMHGSRKKLILEKTGIDFTLDPESDEEINNQDFENNPDKKGVDLNWLLGSNNKIKVNTSSDV